MVALFSPRHAGKRVRRKQVPFGSEHPDSRVVERSFHSPAKPAYRRRINPMKRLFFAAVALLLTSCALFDTGPRVTISRDQRATMDIVVSGDATPAERTACKELGEYLRKVTGADFIVVAEPDFKGGTPAIYLGQTAFAKANGVDFATFGDEEWVIRSVWPDLILAGGRPRGTLYAVYEFLERQVGCHWLSWDSEVIPHQPDLSVPIMHLRGQPAFEPREIYFDWGRRDGEMKIKTEDFLRRNRGQLPFQKDIGGFLKLPVDVVHTFYTYVSPKLWFDKHPEYFSMDAGGKRTYGNIGLIGGSGSQLCLSNPDLPKITADSISQLIRQKEKDFAEQEGFSRKFRVYDLVQEDNASFICLCPECKKISEREGSESGLLILYANRVAELLQQEYPDIKVRVMAYVSTDKPPLKVRPRDNLIVYFADLYGKSECFRPLTHPFNQAQAEMLRGWSAMCKEVHIWDYWDMGARLSTPAVPAMVPAATIAANLRLFRANRVTGMFVENEMGVTQQCFYDLSYWVGIQLMNDPDLSEDELVSTFLNGYYGAAAVPMRGYYEFLAGTMMSETTPMYNSMPVNGRKYLTQEFLVKCRELLLPAEAACTAGSPEQLHVWREMIVVYNCLLNQWSRLKRQTGRDFPFSRDEILNRYEEMRQVVINYQFGPKRQKELTDDLRREIAVLRPALSLAEPMECTDYSGCIAGYKCVEGICQKIPDDPPVLSSGPFVAAGSWPMLPNSLSKAVVLKQNYKVFWTFSDDYASCSGLCTNRARYKNVVDTAWTSLDVSTDSEGKDYAYAMLPAATLEPGDYMFQVDVRDCAGQYKFSPGYYFKVVRP